MNRDFEVDWVSELKSKADIVSIISSYMPLTKRGSLYWGVCPFHHDKNPSMAVNPAGQFYHCFSCKASGDVIKFVSEFESVEFLDACKIIAEKVGYKIPEFSYSPQTKQKVEEKEEVYKVLKDTAIYYNKNLSKPEAKPALEYIEKRGFDKPIVTKFGMGYSPNSDGLPKYLKLKGYSDDIILKAGVCGRSERDKSLYDSLSGRLIIPIINVMGQVVAFGGRVLTSQKVINKYKNTQNGAYFVKNKNLFGINNIVKLKQKERIEYLIMVEGYMDVISLYKSGFYNVVASMGTSLTEGQASLVKRFCNTVYVAYDGDTAGQSATLRSLDIFAKQGLEVKVIQLDEGLDPDEIIKEKGKKHFLDLIHDAKPLIDYKLQKIEEKYDLTKSGERAKYAIEALAMLNEENSPEVREVYVDVISKKSQIQKHRLQEMMDKPELIEVKEAQVQDENFNIDKNIGYIKACRIVINAMLNNKPYAVYTDISKYLTDETHKEVFSYITKNHNNQKFNVIGDLFDQIPESEELSEIVGASLQGNEEWENAEYKQSLQTLKKYYVLEQIEIVTGKIKSCLDTTEKRNLLVSLIELQNELKNFNEVR